MLNRILFTLLFVTTFTAIGSAQYWQKANSIPRNLEQGREIVPDVATVYQLDYDVLLQHLAQAPQRFSNSRTNKVISIPSPDGKMNRFRITRFDVFHPNLTAKYPGFAAYTGFGIDNPEQLLKLSVSPNQVSAIVLAGEEEPYYIDAYSKNSRSYVNVYNKSDYRLDGLAAMACQVEESLQKDHTHGSESRFGDCQLRRYRLAIASTAEYTAFHGGTVESVLEEYNQSMNRVNGIYEQEAGITMQLVPNTDELIFFNAATDPYSNGQPSTMLEQNQNTCDQIIGTENYDIGHVYAAAGGGGIASLASVCSATRKGRGVTGLPSPTGDPFWVDYVCHEMGHQFAATHTYNNSCNNNRTNSTAAEPGSGSTIMAYAGICSPNVQNNTDVYFHHLSLSQMAGHVTSTSGGCGEILNNSNNPPEIAPLVDQWTIPANTPFILEASATDPENDPLRYCFEQRDTRISTQPPLATSTNGPNFRSRNPSSDPFRYFPQKLNILRGSQNQWEVLPSVTRSMNFVVTVRDQGDYGCTSSENIRVSFLENETGFEILSLNEFVSVPALSDQSIEWEVSNSTDPNIACGEVDILLSVDGGDQFNIPLALNVPNDGEHTVTMPANISETCRIQIRCSDNIFLDINNADFEISRPYQLEFETISVNACRTGEAVFSFDYEPAPGSTDPIPVTIAGLPTGSSASIDNNPIEGSQTVNIVISDLDQAEIRPYPIDILLETAAGTFVEQVLLFMNQPTQPEVEAISPVDGQTGLPLGIDLRYSNPVGVTAVEIQVAADAGFENVLLQELTNGSASISGLEPATVYYWRTRALSSCYDAEWRETFAFQTGSLECFENENTEEVTIAETSGNTITSSITVDEEGSIGDVTVSLDIEHTYVGDLHATLTSPDFTEIFLFDRPGIPETNFGCSQDNIQVTFSAAAANDYEAFEASCESDVAISGEYQPLENFSNFIGQSIAGEWTLTVQDASGPDGGALKSWNLTTCRAVSIEPATLTKQTLVLNNTTIGTITDDLLSVTNTDEEATIYTMRSKPQHGDIISDGQILQPGDTFTQGDITAGFVTYNFYGTELSDGFMFDVVNNENRANLGNTFVIELSFDAMYGGVQIVEELSCADGMNGAVVAQGFNGAAPYEYSLNEQPFTSDSNFGGLTAGTYSMTVKDATDIEFTTSFTMVAPPAIVITGESSDLGIIVNAEGGVPPYSYSLDGLGFQEDNLFLGASPGLFDLMVRDANGCMAVLEDFSYEPESTLETLDEEIVLLPNPAQQYISVEATDVFDFDYKVLETSGRVVLSGTAQTTEGINIANISSGIYLLQIQTDEGSATKKFIKVK